jgi:hypothetical protein
MEEQENKHGGRRGNSGRKKVEDKKVTISIYPKNSRVEALGKDYIKVIAIEAIEREYEKTLKTKQP